MITRVAVLGAAVAAVLASTTGYCVIQRGMILEPADFPTTSPPVRILPEAIEPFPIPDLPPT